MVLPSHASCQIALDKLHGLCNNPVAMTEQQLKLVAAGGFEPPNSIPDSGPDTPNSVLERARRDGCGCHPWGRCRHFGGMVIRFVDVGQAADTTHEWDSSDGRYWVSGPSQQYPCVCGRLRITPMRGREPSQLRTNDKDAALAEFHRREEELIRG